MCPINCAGCCFQLCRDTSQQWQRKPCFCGTHWVSKSKSRHVWEEYGVYGVLFLQPYARKVVYTLSRGKRGLLGGGGSGTLVVVSMAMASGRGSPHSSGHSLLRRLLQAYGALFITRKESFVSLLKQRTFEVGTSRILCNWARWRHPSLHIWCEPQLRKSSLCHPKIFCDLAGWQFFFFF